MRLFHPRSLQAYIYFPCLLLLVSQKIALASNHTGLKVSNHDIVVLVNMEGSFDLLALQPFNNDVKVKLLTQHENLVTLIPTEYEFKANTTENVTITVTGQNPGHLVVTAESQPNETWIVQDLFVRITVANSQTIIYLSFIFGWIYFIAWSVSFYPQIYTNFRRNSVIGLNFDFVYLNIVGFALYSVFNCGLYWIPAIQVEYARRHPRGLNPVMLNDVVFSLHAAFATIITIAQCLLYERGTQSVSKTATCMLGLFAFVVTIAASLAIANVIYWLDFLYYCSYIKLTITIIKYVPQALMNYRRKSTIGWSIGTILLDFTGGALSMMQMILNAYNYDDWASLFGDPTKFGLGLFSVLFDVFFMLQHYVFYRHITEITNSSETMESECSPTSCSSPIRRKEVA